MVQQDRKDEQGNEVGHLTGMPSIALKIRRNYLYEDAFDRLSVENGTYCLFFDSHNMLLTEVHFGMNIHVVAANVKEAIASIAPACIYIGSP